MPDPTELLAVAGSAAAGALASSAKEGTAGALSRLFGPVADEVGRELAERYRDRRLRRVASVLRRTERFIGVGDAVLSDRLFFPAIELAANSDDPIVSEYVSGILAGGSGDSEGDALLPYVRLLEAMSSAQVRAHYLFYREWAYYLNFRRDVVIGVDGHSARAAMAVDTDSFAVSMTSGEMKYEGSRISSILAALRRIEVIGGDVVFNRISSKTMGPSPTITSGAVPESLNDRINEFTVTPSVTGCELFMAGLGLGAHIQAFEFAFIRPADTELGLLSGALPRLDVELPALEPYVPYWPHTIVTRRPDLESVPWPSEYNSDEVLEYWSRYNSADT